MAKNFLVEKDGPITTITFNRPEKRNCLNPPVMEEMDSLIRAAGADKEARVLIVTATGNSFSAGADLSNVRHITDPAERMRAFGKEAKLLEALTNRILDGLINLPIPAIAAINGFTIGGGWAITLGFDYRIAVEGAEFWFPEVELGVPLTGLIIALLAAQVGLSLTREMTINGRRFKAEELPALGLLNRVVKREELPTAARQLADTLAQRNPSAVAFTKAATSDWVKRGIR
jgi:enoyl-CoA hydratase/carnithine racemase